MSYHLELCVSQERHTVMDVYLKYKGEVPKSEVRVLDYFYRYLQKSRSLIGSDLKKDTWIKFEIVFKDLKSFLRTKKSKDYKLGELNLQFLNDFDYFLKVHKENKQVTINKKIQRLRQVVRSAIAEEYIDKDPFLLYKAKRVRKEIIFLSTEELIRLEDYEFSQKRLAYIKDLFVFSCYTGLAYKELMNLKQRHLVKGFDGELWIEMTREKTSKPVSIPVLDQALEIIDKYRNNTSKLFPRISNQRYNSYLKEIADIVGIDKRMTTHMARRTFASTVLLYNNVPMEVVSELLGHSSMKITQESYGKIVQKRVSMEVNMLRNKLKM